MIKYNNNTIYDWYFDTSNLIKVYRNNAVCYYKVAGSSPTAQTPCFAVVDDITQYHDTEFVDVFDNATEKWYKLNNLNQFEEYGIYASGRTECQSAPSRLPAGYTEVEYVENTTEGAFLNLGVQLYGAVGNSYTITAKYKSEFMPNWSSGEYLQTIINSEGVSNPYNGMVFRYSYQTHVLEVSGKNNGATWSNVDNGDGTSSVTISCSSTIVSDQVPLGLFASYDGNYNTPYRWSKTAFYSVQVTLNNILVRDLVPCKRDNDEMVGMYDIVNNVFYFPSNYTTYQLTAGEEVTPQQDCVTTYKGKLTIDDDYEYEWNGNSWINLGAISGSVTAINIERDASHNGYIPLGEYFQENTKIQIDFQMTRANGNAIIGDFGSNDNDDWRVFLNYTGSINNLMVYDFNNTRASSNIGNWSKRFNIEIGNYYIKDLNTGTYLVNNTKKTGFVRPNQMYLFHMEGAQGTNNDDYGVIYSLKIYQNDVLVKNFVPFIDANDVYALYDEVNSSTAYPIGSLTGDTEGSVIYPKYYTDKSEPENYVTFDTMEEALAYECPWVGMTAFIDGERYTFDSTNTWVKVLEYYKVEDVTPNAASGWTITQSATYNPDATYYDDFDLETTSTSNSYKVAKVTIFGYEDFTYYLRTSGYSSYNFVVATNVDELSTDPTSISYNDPRAITNTFSWNKAPKSAVNLSNYRRVTYNNLDKNVEHTFYVIFYGRTYSSYIGNATILIPKGQTNENWEQVTFSASTSISGTNKNLYIDGNNSTSGGTNYFYRRWIVGLPSGSHTSYTNYSNYAYCPSVSSATFTSVAGDVRSVNYIYDGINTKTLQIRLVDSNSNVITPSDTVYYSLTKYNACGVGNTSANSYPRSESMPIGGRFVFNQSSNRHYIYGYQLQTALNTDFYTDNYNNTFDIVYSKLNDEAVTITYVTYDPNDAETPAFETEVTWPYGGGTTSSTTLTSYNVPYTYSYTVDQTSNMFSANSQTFTAGQAARTVTFTLYPDNREFASVADMEAYLYAWEGMKATVNGTKYKYENGEWVENTHSLPDVPFSVNYNAKTYNATTKTFAKTEGQLVDVDVTITAGTPTLHDTYVTVVVNTRGVITGYQNYFSRDSSNPNITIVSKLRTDGTYCHVFANRGYNYNWMYRPTSTRLAFHGSSQINGTSVTTQPVIESIRVDSNRLLRFNNYTDNTTTTSSNFSYGGTNNEGVALFAGYTNNTGEWFQGDFYWIYMSQTTLTDEQIQQVIDYNENL